MQKLNWTTQKRKISELIPFNGNPRGMNDKQKIDLQNSIEKFGLVEIPVINLDNTILAGHMRIQTLKNIGEDGEIEVRVPSRNLTNDEAVEYLLRSNKNTGSWDTDKLSEMDMSMLLDIGFNKDEVGDIWGNIGTNDDGFNEKKEIEKAKSTNIKLGQIFKLGDHRLMCGECLKEEDVNKLMDGKKTAMIYCDPPYNIGLNYSSGISGNKNYSDSELNDNKTNIEYKIFIENTLKNALKNAHKDCHVFYWCDEKYIGMVQSIYEENLVVNKRVCLWIKNNQNPTPQIAFNKVYEPCVYGTTGRPFLNKNYRAFNEVLNIEVGSGNQLIEDVLDLYNIWLVKRESSNDYEHPTQKPISLHEKALKRCSAPGTIVLDLFGGSGSTLMACEQMKRICYMTEINPIFCQVIINRYEKLTGEKALLIN